MNCKHGAGAVIPALLMVTEQTKPTVEMPTPSTLSDRMQSGGMGQATPANEVFEIEEEVVELPGELRPGDGLRLSNTPDQMPTLVRELRQLRGMTQAQLGEAIGYPAQVIGNIEQGSRKLGLKTLSDLFSALGGELHIEYRERL